MGNDSSTGMDVTAQSPISARHSLTTHTLISMGIRVSLVVFAVSMLSYWHIVQTLEGQTYDKLEKYIQERGEKESTIFKLAHTYHRIFKKHYLEVWQQGQDIQPDEFDALFESQSDGTTRLRQSYYDAFTHKNGVTSRYNSAYFGKNAPINDQAFRNRVGHAYHLVDRFGPAWVDPFANLYTTFPENGGVVHWPGLDWGSQADANYDITAQEWFYSADKRHNPTRGSTWSGLYYDQTSHRWMVSCITPVDYQDKHLLNIGSDYMLNDLVSRVINDHLDGTYNFIFREDGRLIAHPDKLAALSTAKGVLNIQDVNDPTLNSLYLQAMQAINSGTDKSTVLVNQENDAFLAVAKIDGPGWWFATVYPKDLVSSTARSTAQFIFALSVISLMIELFMLYLVLRFKVVSPLKMFVEASWDVREGKYDEVTSGHLALPEDRKDEVGLLARMLRSMSGTIATNIEDMKHLDNLKNEFMANTSHELRTPLNGIVGIAESMIDGAVGKMTDKQLYNLSLIANSGHRLNHLVNDILDFSKLRHQQLELQLKRTDIHALVNIVILLSGPLVKKTKVRLSNKVEGSVAAVIADENRVQQILYNLIGNAIKFTSKGTIVVSSEEFDDHVAITVSDTGIGIAPEKLTKVFDSFEQAQGTTARIYGGTGLGLAVTKKLVELHHGTIKVTSKLGQGTQFCFTLPICPHGIEADKISDVDRSQALLRSMLVEAMPSDLGDLNDLDDGKKSAGNILVVDDEPINIQVLYNHLRLSGYTVTTASNGKEALSLIKTKGKFDAVLLDVMMPGMTGFEVCQHIRERYLTNQLPVLMVTAKNRVEDMTASFAAGANDFLTKPVAKIELLERVKTQIAMVRLSDDLEKARLQLKSHADELDEKVHQRTEELQQRGQQLLQRGQQLQQRGQQLAQANKELTQANQKVSKSAAEIQMLEELGRHLTSTLDLNQLIENIYQILNNVLTAQILLLGILDKEKQTIHVPLIVEEQKKLSAIDFDLNDMNRPAVWCVQNREELIILEEADIAKYFDCPLAAPMRGKNPKTIVYQPLIIGERIIGCLSVQNMEEHAYSEEQLDMIRTLASYAAIALANAMGYQKLQETHEALKNTQKQLVLQEKMASLGTLTAGVAHEINNPINFVHVGAENLSVDLLRFEEFLYDLADDDTDDDVLDSFKQQFAPLYEHISTIKSGSRRIKNIVEDLRAFTQINSVKKKPTHINDCIESTINLIKTQNIDVAKFITNMQPTTELLCYTAQLNQVFMNIIVNGCDAIKEKQKQQNSHKMGKIVIDCHMEDEFIIVAVQDDGCGMTDEIRNKLFEPFYTTKVVGKGTGLGMAIAFGIIEDHGGTIAVDSSLGVGTTITVSLPVL